MEDESLLIMAAVIGLIIFMIYDYMKTKSRCEELEDTKNKLINAYNQKEKELKELHGKHDALLKKYETEENFKEALRKMKQEVSSFPYIAGMVADVDTRGLELVANSLEWGDSKERRRKTVSIRALRAETQQLLREYKIYEYQLKYLLELYPNLQDIIDSEYKSIPKLNEQNLEEYDKVREYLSKEEYAVLTQTSRNQLALNRYIESHKKSKWQIGRDYEMCVGYGYECKGYTVDYFGSFMGLEDLGRDLIAKKNNVTLIIQCKYWSGVKQIHEKHITQLYGTMIGYCVEHVVQPSDVHGVLITNIELSETAKRFAEYLGIQYKENYKMTEFPRIKCNIGKDGERIYHLPFDQQYDSTKIDKPGEFMATTVLEAENAGFRRALKWFGSN